MGWELYMVVWESSKRSEASHFLQKQEQNGKGNCKKMGLVNAVYSPSIILVLSFRLTPLFFCIWWQSSFGKVTIQIDRVVMLGAVSGEYTLLPESKSGPSRNLEIEFQWSNKWYTCFRLYCDGFEIGTRLKRNFCLNFVLFILLVYIATVICFLVYSPKQILLK